MHLLHTEAPEGWEGGVDESGVVWRGGVTAHTGVGNMRV